MGWETGIDLYGVMDVAEDLIGSELGITPIVNRRRSCWAMPASTRASCAMPRTRPSASASRPRRFSKRSARAKRSAVRKTSSSSARSNSRTGAKEVEKPAAGTRDRLMTSVATDKVDWRARRELFGRSRERREIEPLTDTWPALDERTAYADPEAARHRPGQGRVHTHRPASSSASPATPSRSR